MNEALREAEKAFAQDEVPVGAVVVRDGKIIARGFDRKESDRDPTAHAELIALRNAAKRLGTWRLEGTVLYVTLEPCAMCAGALIQARVDTLVYGADNFKFGAVRTLAALLDVAEFNHTVEVVPGVLKEECAQMLSEYFREKRSGKRLRKDTKEQEG